MSASTRVNRVDTELDTEVRVCKLELPSLFTVNLTLSDDTNDAVVGASKAVNLIPIELDTEVRVWF